MIWEERRVTLRRGAFDAHQRIMLDQVWPDQRRSDARPLCLLSTVIGAPATETVAITGYRDAEGWLTAQNAPPHPGRAELVEGEEATLLLGADGCPVEDTPAADRRLFYGLRRFTIRPSDWEEFVRLSAEGVWPVFRLQGAAILGLFRTAATTSPLGVTLLTGYHSLSHWEATRTAGPRPDIVPEERWQGVREAVQARARLTIASHVWLMRAYWPTDQG